MAFLRNIWCCAGCADEISDQPIGRTLPGDAPAIRARRLLAGMIEKEQAEV